MDVGYEYRPNEFMGPSSNRKTLPWHGRYAGAIPAGSMSFQETVDRVGETFYD